MVITTVPFGVIRKRFTPQSDTTFTGSRLNRSYLKPGNLVIVHLLRSREPWNWDSTVDRVVLELRLMSQTPSCSFHAWRRSYLHSLSVFSVGVAHFLSLLVWRSRQSLSHSHAPSPAYTRTRLASPAWTRTRLAPATASRLAQRRAGRRRRSSGCGE